MGDPRSSAEVFECWAVDKNDGEHMLSVYSILDTFLSRGWAACRFISVDTRGRNSAFSLGGSLSHKHAMIAIAKHKRQPK